MGLLYNVKQGQPRKSPVQEITTSGAITIKEGLVVLTEAGVSAVTLANPVSDGLFLHVVSATAQAHTLDLVTGVNGTAADVGTFGGAIGDGVVLASLGGVWYSFANTNVVFA